MRRSLVLFVLIFNVALALIYFYLADRLAGNQTWAWTLLAVPFLAFASFPLVIRSPHRSRDSGWREIWIRVIFLCIGLLTYLLVFTVGRQGLQMATEASWATNTVVVILALIALWVGSHRGRRGPIVKEIVLKVEKLPAALENFRIVQLSDLHIGAAIRRPYVERVVRMVAEARPDLIALTGDIGDGPLNQSRDAVAPLAELPRLAPSFYVLGNHEYYHGAAAWADALQNLGVQVLLNQSQCVKVGDTEILVAGITDPVSVAQGPDVDAAWHAGQALAPDASYRILLSHRPNFAEQASRLGFDLQLSGHTHGGQFFPWTLVTRLVHRLYLGLYRRGSMWVYVSAGTGSWGPLIRLGTTPEVTCLRLERA